VSFDWVDHGVTARGVSERRFDARRAGRVIPGVLWMPEDPPAAPPPLVLMGHGGSAHKRQDYIVGLGRRLVRHHGLAAVAIDGPVHGDRRADAGADIEAVNKDFWRTWRDDPAMTDEMVADWRAVLDALQEPGRLGAGPVGWWGLSMGTILGLPVVLMGFTPPDENAHAPNEWMDLNNYETSIRAIARVFDELVDLPR